ncbi:hypothetical protein SAMN04487947_0492 [Halogeometricum rufum]|uniref:Uncharacterized protein n=1 Tax=Halogeometricum rufum TaxID=553469 RepID=A0A1I6G344_9EURY|nr:MULTISPECIES: hypothetical protein [Halogeometricum]SFR36638.1 hypothetical protein SAMN04487947_0492 [Halogeometricum rufum]
MRALPAMLAFVLVLSAVAGATVPGTASLPDRATTPVDAATVAAPAPDDRSFEHSTSRSDVSVVNNHTAQNASIHVLGIPQAQVTQSSLATRTVELGPALAFDHNRTEMRMETLAAVDRIDAADSEDRKQQLILQELTTIEQAAISLRASQQAAIRAYGEGDIDSRTLLIRLAVIDIHAQALQDRNERIQRVARSVPDFSVDARTASLGRELDTFTGPVRQHSVAVLTGEADPARFFVQTGTDSVVLSTIRDDTYVREVYRGDIRRRGSGLLTDLEALNATSQAYPNAFALQFRQNGTNIVGTEDNSFLVRIQHERGRLYSFVDSGSQQVFKEFQYRPLETMETDPTEGAVKDGLELTAYQTYPGGPVRITLNTTESGDPADALITVGPRGGRSVVVGETGADGSLWTMAPGQEYQVTAIRGNSVVLLTVEPNAPPLVNGNATQSGNATAVRPPAAATAGAA